MKGVTNIQWKVYHSPKKKHIHTKKPHLLFFRPIIEGYIKRRRHTFNITATIEQLSC